MVYKLSQLNIIDTVQQNNLFEPDLVYIITAGRGKKGSHIYRSLDRYSVVNLIKVENKVREIIRNPKTKAVILGGAIGGDTIFLSFALAYRTGKLPKLYVILPVNLEFQSRETWSITKKADEIIEMNQEPRDKDGQFRKIIYRNRNEKMIEKALEIAGNDKSKVKCVAFWNEVKMYSGTYSTICMAQKKYGLAVEIISIKNASNFK